MKIYKIAQATVPQAAPATGTAPSPGATPTTAPTTPTATPTTAPVDPSANAMKTQPNQPNQMNPQITMAIRQALQNSQLSKTQVMPFLNSLFAALGDVSFSSLKNAIQSVQEQDNTV